MNLSSRAKYGLKLCFLIAISADSVVPLSKLVRQTGLSEKYLEQILLKLRSEGILKSMRGVNGGYSLNRPPEEITFGNVLEALDDKFEFGDCLDGTCRDQYCPNRKFFQRISDGINGQLDAVTIKDMVDEYKCI